MVSISVLPALRVIDAKVVVRKTVKSSMSPALWFIFNIVFIAGAQSVLLFLITTPAYILLLATKMGMPLATIDTVFPRAFIALILMAFMADQQQWSQPTLWRITLFRG
jgi:hypothetical protein